MKIISRHCSTFEREVRVQVMVDDLNQVRAAVALRAPDLSEAVPEGRRQLSKHTRVTSQHHSERQTFETAQAAGLVLPTNTSFLPKSPPGFMVATRRKVSWALISSTSLSSPLPFSARTRHFSVSRTLKTKFPSNQLESALKIFNKQVSSHQTRNKNVVL